MDLVTQARLEKINELAEAVYLASQRTSSRDARSVHSAYLGLSPRDLARYSLARAISVSAGLEASDHGGFERECSNELNKRFDLPLGAVAVPRDVLEHRALKPGGYLTGVSAPDGLSFFDMLRNASYTMRLGAQSLPDLKNDAGIPRQVTDPTFAWIAPTGAATPSDSAFGQLSATPKQGLVITEVSESLLRQSSADRIITAGLAAVTAVGIDRAVIAGAGGVEPLGILNATGVGTASGTSLAYAGLVGVQKTVADANAILNANALGYIATPTVAELLKNRQRFTSTDSPLWSGALNDGTIEGVRAVATKQMSSASLVYGDWSTVWIADWGPFMISADRSGTRFNQALVAIRVYAMIDVLLTSPGSFVKITGIT